MTKNKEVPPCLRGRVEDLGLAIRILAAYADEKADRPQRQKARAPRRKEGTR